MSKENIVVFGTSETAQIANYYFDTYSNYEVVAFSDNTANITQNLFISKPVSAFENVITLYPNATYKMFVSLSYQQRNELLDTKYLVAKSNGYSLISCVSSHYFLLSQYPFGDYCSISENNTTQPFVKIGNYIALRNWYHFGHHSTIKDHNYISSQMVVSGHCIIHSYMSVNATPTHQVSAANNTLLKNGKAKSKNTETSKDYIPPASMLLDKSSNEITL